MVTAPCGRSTTTGEVGVTALSALIPTRDRPELLRDCLRTLAGQDIAAGALEVIVVDDGSVSDLRAVVREIESPRVVFRYERQKPAGLNVARNTGASVARGDLLAYLDDDTLVDEGWGAAVLDGFERTGCDGLAGRIELRLEGPEPRWLTPHLRSFLTELVLDAPPGPLPDGRVPFGANCAVTRSALLGVDGFRTGLDREGRSLLSNGDVEFFERVRRGGGRLVWWPAAGVLHRVPPERLTRPWFRRRVWAQGLGDGLLGEPGVGVAAGEFLRAWRAVPILAKGLATGRGTFASELWVRYCIARAAGLRAVRRGPASSRSRAEVRG